MRAKVVVLADIGDTVAWEGAKGFVLDRKGEDCIVQFGAFQKAINRSALTVLKVCESVKRS